MLELQHSLQSESLWISIFHEIREYQSGAIPVGSLAPAGNAHFVPVLDPEGSMLLRVELNGDIRVLRNNLGGNFTAWGAFTG
jgi:hypothetical protein